MVTRQGALILREFIAHRLLGTPLERPARLVAELPKRWHLRQYPELEEVYLESDRIHQLMLRVLQPSMNCIDIGCHIGSVLQKMCQIAPQGQHMAIEPVPYKANWLRQKFPQAKILQLALNDSPGQSSFYIQKEQSGYSGLRLHSPMPSTEPSLISPESIELDADAHSTCTSTVNLGTDEASPVVSDTSAVVSDTSTVISKGVIPDTVEELQVECQRLADVVTLDHPIGFIKVDVEGAELNVLRGGAALLDRWHPVILFECTLTALASFETTSWSIYEFLHQHGYAIYLIKDYLEHARPLSYEAFDRAMHYPFQAFNFVAVAE